MLSDALLRKLSVFADFNSEELAFARELTGDVRTVAAKQHIVTEGDDPEFLHLIVQGWAARYKTLRDGSRQITALLIPGDTCDLHARVLGMMDHSVITLTPCKVGWIHNDALDRLTVEHPGLTRALWWATLFDETIARAWIVNQGRRNAYARIAHLLCELYIRMAMIGLAEGARMDLPLTQEELADTTGLTSVHVNRTLRRLRHDGLIELSKRILTIMDLEALKEAAGFDSNYLHFVSRSRSVG